MRRRKTIVPIFVEFIPERLDEGVLYISRRYSTASHACCCGCGLEVVTPLNRAKWRLCERGGAVSLTPSIGNWNFPCKSHYWVDRNRVVWAGRFSEAMIARARERDKCDVERSARTLGRSSKLFRRITAALRGSRH